jgi:hypothetical protein
MLMERRVGGLYSFEAPGECYGVTRAFPIIPLIVVCISGSVSMTSAQSRKSYHFIKRDTIICHQYENPGKPQWRPKARMQKAAALRQSRTVLVWRLHGLSTLYWICWGAGAPNNVLSPVQHERCVDLRSTGDLQRPEVLIPSVFCHY